MYGQFLLGRQGLYYFRKRIPQKLVHILNKREIKLSLKTSNKKKAKIIASQLLVNVEMGLIDLNNSKREHVLTDFQRLINHLRDTIKLFHNSKNIAPLNLIYAQTTKTETIKQIGYDEAFTLYENLTASNK